MRQAQTLNEAQLRRVLHYCRSRRHPVRDQTIVLFSFYAGLRAKEIAGLTVGDVFDEGGAVREQFILSAAQSKGGQRRTVYVSQRLRKAFAEYGDTIKLSDPQRPLFESQKGGAFRRTPCANCSWTSTRQLGSKTLPAIQGAEHTSHDWPTRVWACACWQHWQGTATYQPHSVTLT